MTGNEGIQCCHMLPARSSAFLVASAAFLPHLPRTSLTESKVAAKIIQVLREYSCEIRKGKEEKRRKEIVTLSRRSGNGRRSDIGIGIFGHGSGSIAGDWGTRFSIERWFLVLRRRWNDVVWVQFRVRSIIGGVRLRCRLGFFLFCVGGLGLGFVRFGGGGLGLGLGLGLDLGLGGGFSTHVVEDRSDGDWEWRREREESVGLEFQMSNSAKIVKLI